MAAQHFKQYSNAVADDEALTPCGVRTNKQLNKQTTEQSNI